MKKKKIIYITISIFVGILLLVLIGVIIFLLNPNTENNKNVKTNSGENIELLNIDNRELIKGKLEVLKNRLKMKDIISRGDNYFQNDQLSLAVIQYKIALNKTPDDPKLIEKIGDIYYELKNFEEANNYYTKILNNQGFDVNKYILSLIYSNDILKKSLREYIKVEIERNIKDKEKVFFYSNSLFCIEDFHLCKKYFDEKIITDKDNIKSPELTEIKNAIKTYTDFGLVDLYYKNTLIIGAFMKLKIYPVSIFLGKKLLEEKQDYKAILQIISQSYFDLGNYKSAYLYLKKYFELTPTDANAAYILGVTNLKLKDYILSNIFLNKAIYLGFKDTLNARRKIAYNYYMLHDYDKMYNVFDDIVNSEKSITKDDINILINHSIESGKTDKTYNWTKKGIKLFPKEPVFYAYMGKLELDKGKLSLSSIYIKKGLKIDPNNQMLNYVLGLLYIKENKKDDARISLQKAYDIDKKSILSKEIKKEIDSM